MFTIYGDYALNFLLFISSCQFEKPADMTSPALDPSAQPPPSEPYSQTLLLVDEDQYLSNKRKIELEMLQVKLEEKKYRLGLKKMRMELEKENMKVKKAKMEMEIAD